jgi:hypothetical protein
MIKGKDRFKAARISCLYTFFLAARGAPTAHDAFLEELVRRPCDRAAACANSASALATENSFAP